MVHLPELQTGSSWRSFDYADITKRDKVNLDIFWLKDESLEDSDDLPDPEEAEREQPQKAGAVPPVINAVQAADPDEAAAP